MKRFPLVFTAFLAAGASVAITPLFAQAAGSESTSRKKITAKKSSTKTTAAKPLPKYVSLATLKKLQAQRAQTEPLPVLQPFIDGKSLKGKNMKDLATNPPYIVVNAKVGEVEAGATADADNGNVNDNAADNDNGEMLDASAQAMREGEATIAKSGMDGQLIAQAFPAGGVRPAPIRRTPLRTVTPQWVRYPLEFQLAGIGLGTKAVEKDKFNRIDRYGLFAIHGNPTAVVVPTGTGNITVTQQPPEVAGLFPDGGDGGLPDWAAAVTVALDNNHVEWLYRRETYAMGFVVDRLGFVDAIVVAGTYSPIAKTQLEDPIHTIQLGVDDFRKVMNRYGYPDSVETYQINTVAGTGITNETPAQTTGGAAEGGAATGAGGAAGGGQNSLSNANGVFRTFELRYEQSYNIVFTVRNNRVVRIYIFGDPDFFNAQRRNSLRTRY